MSSPEQELVLRDPGVPGLSVLLEDVELTGWLARHAPTHTLLRRRYLRYKPGTSCVLALDLTGPGGPVECSLTALAPDAAPKLDKTVDKAPDGTVLATDDDRLLQLATAAADRDLPALAALESDRDAVLTALLPGTSWAGAALRTLSHKPQRRWVGLLTATDGTRVLLRAHRPAVAATTVPALHALAGCAPRTPHVLGADLTLGLVALEHLPGRVLAGPGAADLPAVRAAGVALAQLHGAPLPGVELPGVAGLRTRPAGHHVEAARRAADTVGVLLPGLARRAADLADVLAVRIAEGTGGERVPCHGDFSLDQVVRAPDGTVGLVDLDEVARDEPASDLATAAAAARAADPASSGAVLDALHDGYRTLRALPPAGLLAAHTGALLLRRAAEPFRLAHPRWVHETTRLLAEAEELA